LNECANIDTAAAAAAAVGGTGSGTMEVPGYAELGTLHFSLTHDAEASALVVTVAKATGLQQLHPGDYRQVSNFVVSNSEFRLLTLNRDLKPNFD